MNDMFDVHVETHCVDSVCVWQLGNMPPLTTSVAQHSGVLPEQSLGVAHWSVFAELQVAVQADLPASSSRQQTSPPPQAAVGHTPASLLPLLEPPELLLLDPLLLPEVLPLLLPPDPLPLEPELPVLPEPLAVPELPPPLPLPELDPFPPSSGIWVPLEPLQPVVAAPARTRTRTLGATRNEDWLGMRVGSGAEYTDRDSAKRLS
jgi:hypothetical protein